VDVVLDRDWNPEQRSPLPRDQPALGLGRFAAGGLGAQATEGVQGRLAGLDPGEGVVEQLERTEIPRGETARLVEQGAIVE
jgi:hypothetical protein